MMHLLDDAGVTTWPMPRYWHLPPLQPRMLSG